MKPNPNHPRAAFTLLELVLVLAILILIASLSGPALLRSIASTGLDKGCDMVRSEMARARVKAIKTGHVHALVFAPGGRGMAILDFDNLAANQSLQRMDATQFDQSTNLVSDDNLLPRGITFAAGEAISNSRSEFVTENSKGGSSGSVRPILFYPDGTCQDARIVLSNTKGDVKQVVLRSLTGSSRVTEVPGGQ
jgi:Tfp pilus assembly protein FimT